VDKAVELFLTQPVEVAIASMPEGKDPDEYLLEHGADGFQKLLDEAQDALSYKWKQLARQFEASADNLTGQQKAVEAYLDLLAGARGLGPIDALRWGAALARVSRLTQISVEDLNRRFRQRPGRRPPYGRPSEDRPAQANVAAMPTKAVRRGESSPSVPAERWIMGALLLEPARWHAVQARVHVEDFADADLKALAEIYWSHQRNEGEPVFNEFLGLLDGPALKELAINLLAEVEEQEQVKIEQGLNEAIDSLAWARTEAERRQMQASLGDKVHDEIEQLRRLNGTHPRGQQKKSERLIKHCWRYIEQ